MITTILNLYIYAVMFCQSGYGVVGVSMKDRKGFKKDILTNTDLKLISTLTKYNFLFRGLFFSPKEKGRVTYNDTHLL